MADPHQNRIDILDYARFCAAFLVMGFHYFFLGVKENMPGIGFSKGWSDVFQFGHAGVSLFFMISGYVIFFSSKGRTAAQFVSARVLRLYPVFLVALIGTTLALNLYGTLSEAIRPLQFLQNLTMLPTYFGGAFVDGSYWTLRLEICFYALIFVIILIGASAHLERFFLMWPIIILISQITPFGMNALLSCYSAYFAAGALFAMRRSNNSWLIKILLVLCYFESLYWSSILSHPLDTGNKVMLVLISSFYIFFVFMNSYSILCMRLPGAQLVGAITYPLYLIHQAVGYLVIRTFATPSNKVAITLGTMGAMVLVAYLLHRIIEIKAKPVSKRLINVLVAVPIAFLEKIIRSTIITSVDKAYKLR